MVGGLRLASSSGTPCRCAKPQLHSLGTSRDGMTKLVIHSNRWHASGPLHALPPLTRQPMPSCVSSGNVPKSYIPIWPMCSFEQVPKRLIVAQVFGLSMARSKYKCWVEPRLGSVQQFQLEKFPCQLYIKLNILHNSYLYVYKYIILILLYIIIVYIATVKYIKYKVIMKYIKYKVIML